MDELAHALQDMLVLHTLMMREANHGTSFYSTETHRMMNEVPSAARGVLLQSGFAPLPASEPPEGKQHEWVKSTLGHGDSMCRNCFITNREAAAIGAMNECDAPEIRRDHNGLVVSKPTTPKPPKPKS